MSNWIDVGTLSKLKNVYQIKAVLQTVGKPVADTPHMANH